MVVKVNVKAQIDKLKVKKEIDSDHKVKVISTRFGASKTRWTTNREGLEMQEKRAGKAENSE